MFRASFMKNVPLFLRNFGENVALCLLASGVETSSVAVQKLVSLRWREALTASVHRTYFQNMVRPWSRAALACREQRTAAPAELSAPDAAVVHDDPCA